MATMAAPTVLLVEDDTNGRRIFREVLSRMGFNVVVAIDGMDALNQCAQHHTDFDLLLTDLVMPRINGIDLSRRVRALYPNIDVIFTSGFTELAARQCGFDIDGAFLEKPICTRQLRDVVAHIMHGFF
jgi:CheY-like chemotaxis protein